MASSFLEDAENLGFEQGWSDGFRNRVATPQPALGIGLVDLSYLKAFKAGYLDGHATAKEELKTRRHALLKSKTTRLEVEKER